MTAVVGCGTAGPRKLTSKQVEEVLAAGSGQRETTGQHRPADGQSWNVRLEPGVRWKEKGKSTRFRERQVEPVEVISVGGREYDASRCVFLLRHKEEDGPVKVAEEHYDPATRTFRGKGALSADLRVETAHQRIDRDTWKWTMTVLENDRVVFSSEPISRRVDGRAEP